MAVLHYAAPAAGQNQDMMAIHPGDLPSNARVCSAACSDDKVVAYMADNNLPGPETMSLVNGGIESAEYLAGYDGKPNSTVCAATRLSIKANGFAPD